MVTVLCREPLELSFEAFCCNWAPAFAITCHGAQGTTWDWTFAICGWDRMDARMRYTAFSRSTRMGQVLKFK